MKYCFDDLAQERRNSIANALELRLSCTNPSIWSHERSKNCWKKILDVAVSFAPPDGLALLAARPSTGTVRTKFDTGPALRGAEINWNQKLELPKSYAQKDLFSSQNFRESKLFKEFILILCWCWSTLRVISYQLGRNINSSPPIAAYMHQWIGLTLVKIMAYPLFGVKPLSIPMLGYCQLDP